MLSRVQHTTAVKETPLDSYQESKIDSIKRHLHLSKAFARETISGRKELRGRVSLVRKRMTGSDLPDGNIG
jgi:hypothetical protein